MIKKSNPDKTNKQELIIELNKIKEKHISVLERNIINLKELKSKIIDLKVNIEDGFFSQTKSMFKLAQIMEKLADNNTNSEKLETLQKELIRSVDFSDKYMSRLRKFNDTFIEKLLALANVTIIELQAKIKKWKSERKSRKLK